MSNNSSKQILLSVISVAVLIVAVVGVSFAVFSYTRTGAVQNQITTGTLVFSFDDGDAIALSNHFPISTTAGKSLDANTSGNVCTFTIRGNAVAGTASYTIYAVNGEAVTGKTRFDDAEVFAYIESSLGTGATASNFTFTAAGNYGNGAPLTGLASGDVTLGSGTLSATTTATRNFTVRMWVDSSVVSISDTDTGSHIYTTTAYGNLYYTMKIKVTASA